MAHFELREEQLQQSPVHMKALSHTPSLFKVSQLTACVIPVTTEVKKIFRRKIDGVSFLICERWAVGSIVFPVLDIH